LWQGVQPRVWNWLWGDIWTNGLHCLNVVHSLLAIVSVCASLGPFLDGRAKFLLNGNLAIEVYMQPPLCTLILHTNYVSSVVYYVWVNMGFLSLVCQIQLIYSHGSGLSLAPMIPNFLSISLMLVWLFFYSILMI